MEVAPIAASELQAMLADNPLVDDDAPREYEGEEGEV